jgi:hypothetical protein
MEFRGHKIPAYFMCSERLADLTLHKNNKIENVYSAEYTKVPKLFFTPIGV